MKVSARNVLKGTVVKIEPGSINTEVVIRLADGIEIVSMISKHAAENLGLKVGGPGYAIIKATSVMVGAD